MRIPKNKEIVITGPPTAWWDGWWHSGLHCCRIQHDYPPPQCAAAADPPADTAVKNTGMSICYLMTLFSNFTPE